MHWLRAGIRDHVVTAVELKFNCFFLMPLIDTFPTRLREELEAAYEEDLDEVRPGFAGSTQEETLRTVAAAHLKPSERPAAQREYCSPHMDTSA